MSNKPGVNRLASVIKDRMQQEADGPLILDFGEIKGSALVTNTFPIQIPAQDYSVNAALEEDDKLSNGDRVLVAWVGNSAVVICKVTSGRR